MEEGTTAREKAETERGKIFRIDERLLEDHLGRVVRSGVEETLKHPETGGAEIGPAREGRSDGR